MLWSGLEVQSRHRQHCAAVAWPERCVVCTPPYILRALFPSPSLSDLNVCLWGAAHLWVCLSGLRSPHTPQSNAKRRPRAIWTLQLKVYQPNPSPLCFPPPHALCFGAIRKCADLYSNGGTVTLDAKTFGSDSEAQQQAVIDATGCMHPLSSLSFHSCLVLNRFCAVGLLLPCATAPFSPSSTRRAVPRLVLTLLTPQSVAAQPLPSVGTALGGAVLNPDEPFAGAFNGFPGRQLLVSRSSPNPPPAHSTCVSHPTHK